MNRVYIMPHFGLGDIINMNGAIRYYATKYNEVIVACPKDKIDNIKLFFKDVPTIKIEEPIYWEDNIIKKYNCDKIYLCGFHKSTAKLGDGDIIMYHDVDYIPDCFYKDLELDPKFRNKYFSFQPTPESYILYNLVKDRKYIFIHNKSSTLTIDMQFLNGKKEDYLLINCAMNMYNKDEIEYALTERFINRKIIHYSSIIENAYEIHLIDSSIFCFANHLNLSNVKVKKLYINSDREVYQHYIQPGFEQILLSK